jgi:hypothetical protein
MKFKKIRPRKLFASNHGSKAIRDRQKQRQEKPARVMRRQMAAVLPVGTAAFIRWSSICLSYFAACCGGGGGFGKAVSMRIFHCPPSRMSTAVQRPEVSIAAPLWFFPLIVYSPIQRAMSAPSGHA